MKILSNKPLVGLVVALVLFLGIDVCLGWRWFKLKQEKQITLQGKIKVTSLIPGYKLEIADQSQLNSFLKEVGFWQENAIVDIRDPSYKTTAKSLSISLVPEVEDYWWRQTTEEKETVAAVGSKATGEGEAKIDFFVWNKILIDEDSLNRRPTPLLIRGLYGLMPQLRSGAARSNQEKEEQINNFISTYYQKYPNLLKITTD